MSVMGVSLYVYGTKVVKVFYLYRNKKIFLFRFYLHNIGNNAYLCQMNNSFMRKITLFLFLLLCVNGIAQRHDVLDESIASLQVVADDNWLSLPMIELRSHQHINIGFDDLSHTYRRFAYKIEHCESDWTVSDQLFQSDFIDGFATGNLIEDIEESINTTVLYTHYSFSIPNRQCRLKMSAP